MFFTVPSILWTHTVKPDFNGDGFTDLLWRGMDTGTIAAWNMSQDGLSGTAGLFAPSVSRNLHLKGIGDFNGDGTTDLIWQSAVGAIETWTVRDNQVISVQPIGSVGASQWIQALGDFNGDGYTDLLWYVPRGTPGYGSVGLWFTGSAEVREIPPLGLGQIAPFDNDYVLVGVGDFDGDNRDGILFRGTGDHLGTFLMQEPVTAASREGQMPTAPHLLADPGQDWAVLDLADFNGDGRTDILWQHYNGASQADARSIWLMDGNGVIGGGMVANPGSDWSVVGTDDYDNDGKADLLWQHGPTGWNSEWLMNGADVKGLGGTYSSPGDFWYPGGV
jgi:hypothetical protein